MMRTGSVYLLTALLCVAVLIPVLKLRDADLSIPLYYSVGGDVFFHLALFKSITDTGWYVTNPWLGAPGTMDLHDFPYIETGMFLAVKLLALVRQDPFWIANIFYLATFPLAALSALFAFRRFGVVDPIAVAGSLLFAFAPYHFWRGMAHPHLSAYYPIPLLVMTALWLCSGEPLFCRRDDGGRFRPSWSGSRSALALGSCILISIAGPYYAFFGTFFLIAASVIGQLHRPGWARLGDAGVLVGLVVGSLALQLAPFVAYTLRQGANTEAHNRKISDYYLYGLRVTNMLLPTTGHRINTLRHVSMELTSRPSTPEPPRMNPSAARRNASPESQADPFSNLPAMYHKTNEAVTCTPLGFVGSAGFLALVVLALGRPRQIARDTPALIDLGRLNLAALLLSVVGGFGELITWFVTTRIRCYNRISIFVEFFSIFALALLLSRAWRDRMAAGRSVFGLAVLVGLGLILGLLDEIPGVIAPDHPHDRSTFESDRKFIQKVESTLTPESLVFELPAATFPEFGIVFRMYDYDQFRGYLHSRRIHWSYGAVRGRETERWQSEMALLPFPLLVRRLTEAHFAGLWVNRRGYGDHGNILLREFEQILPQALLVSNDGELLFYRIPASGNARFKANEPPTQDARTD